MVLTNSFAWDDLPRTDADGETSTMATRLPVIKKLVKRMVISGSIIFNVINFIIRLTGKEQRKTLANSFYVFDISFSPVYELIVLSQVHPSHATIFCSH
jgi:hypothetical protein